MPLHACSPTSDNNVVTYYDGCLYIDCDLRHVRGYQGGDSYEEFCGHTASVQHQLDDLENDGIDVDAGLHLDVEVLGASDSAFLNAIRGKCGCTATYLCEECDIHIDQLHMSKADFERVGEPLPLKYDYKTNLMLTHSLGENYVYNDENREFCVLNKPYNFHACGLLIEKDGDHPPKPGKTASQTTTRRRDWQNLQLSHRHGCPDGFKGRPIVDCLLHANLDIWPQVWWATIFQNVDSEELAATVLDVVQNNWHVHRVKEDMVKKNDKKIVPHFKSSMALMNLQVSSSVGRNCWNLCCM